MLSSNYPIWKTNLHDKSRINFKWSDTQVFGGFKGRLFFHVATVFKSYVTAPLVISNMATAGPTVWYQTVLNVKPKSRGVHVITDEIEKIPELKKYKVGLAHLLLQHTSASICVNECWDSSVRHDMEMMLNRLAPEQGPPYKHTIEGPDDMPG